MKRRDLTAEERALWQRAMRNTTPLPGRKTATGTQVEENKEPSRRMKPAPAPGPSRPSVPGGDGAAKPVRSASTKSSPAPPPGVDAATRRRVRRGRMEIHGRVDLHGMRQWEAHGALNRFIADSQAAGRRCVLVITGKGGHPAPNDDASFMHRQEDGVLRRRVPLWLTQEPNASRVFAVEPAHVRHGGSGAFYVFLRKEKKEGD